MQYEEGYIQRMAQLLLDSSDPEVTEQAHMALEKANEHAHRSTYKLRSF